MRSDLQRTERKRKKDGGIRGKNETNQKVKKKRERKKRIGKAKEKNMRKK